MKIQNKDRVHNFSKLVPILLVGSVAFSAPIDVRKSSVIESELSHKEVSPETRVLKSETKSIRKVVAPETKVQKNEPKIKQKQSVPQEGQTVNIINKKSSKTISSPTMKIREIDQAGTKGGQVTDKIEKLGQSPRDPSNLNQMSEESEGLGMRSPTGDSLSKDSGQMRSPTPGTEKADFLTLPTQEERESTRKSLGEPFGLTTEDPRERQYDDAKSSFESGGAGDSRLMADDDKKETDGSVTTSGKQPDGTYNMPYENDDGTITNVTASPSTKPAGILGRAMKFIESTLGTDSGKDNEGPSVGGVRGTPEPDDAGTSRTPLTPEQKAKIMEATRAKTGMGGDPLEPGATRSTDPSAIKENASKLTKDYRSPYIRPLDESSGGSEEFSGFGNEPIKTDLKDTLVDPMVPELEGAGGGLPDKRGEDAPVPSTH
ncbi:MAG: hypothetical protein WBF77_01785 [Sulfurimonadaceae bacterium]